MKKMGGVLLRRMLARETLNLRGLLSPQREESSTRANLAKAKVSVMTNGSYMDGNPVRP